MIPRFEMLECSMCGRKYSTFAFDDSSRLFRIMQNRNVCYKCAFWQDIIDNRPEHLEIVRGIAYRFLPYQYERLPNYILGNGGRVMYILGRDGIAKKSNDVWEIGEVPQHFREKLPNTAYLVDKNIYTRSQRRVSLSCNKVGCFDRYHCYFYDYKQEYETGPYNKVPKDWTVGGEKCPTFINICKIPDYEDYF